MDPTNEDIEKVLKVLQEHSQMTPLEFLYACTSLGVSYASTLRAAKLLLDAGIIFPTTISGRIIAYQFPKLSR